MTELFDVKDLLTVATADQAVVGTKGYFCDGLQSLAVKIKQSDVGTLASVAQDNAYCFKNYNGVSYIFFLPKDKVKKSHTYRPLKTLAELIDFLVPEYEVDVCDVAPDKMEIAKYKNAETLLGRKIILRLINNKNTTVKVIQNIGFRGDGNTSDSIYLNNEPLDFLFDNYEILIDWEWVPFGVKK